MFNNIKKRIIYTFLPYILCSLDLNSIDNYNIFINKCLHCELKYNIVLSNLYKKV